MNKLQAWRRLERRRKGACHGRVGVVCVGLCRLKQNEVERKRGLAAIESDAATQEKIPQGKRESERME